MAGDDESDDPTDEGELVQVNHLVPENIKERAQRNSDEWGELSEAVREVYRLYARRGEFGDIGKLEVELLKVEHDRDRIQEQIDELQNQLDIVQDRKRHIEEQIEEVEVRDDEYDALLEEIEEEIYDGASVFTDHGMIQEAATVSGQTAEEVISDLRDRNPELPDAAFKERREADEVWNGL